MHSSLEASGQAVAPGQSDEVLTNLLVFVPNRHFGQYLTRLVRSKHLATGLQNPSANKLVLVLTSHLGAGLGGYLQDHELDVVYFSKFTVQVYYIISI